ncbi:MAG: LysR family transcriptional regulator [Gammaproteobacteria bacterium]|nr:LysR family transcriptional regulator [Gammaproteobacteria bacterium]
MTLEQLRVLQKIVELGSLKAAANALHKTQPALSMAIKKLEQQYNITLLDRSQYRLSLTAQGDIFFRHAQQILLGADQLDSLGHQLAQGNEPVLKIAYNPVFAISTISDVLLECQRQFPLTEFQIITGSRFSALEQIKNHEVDIAISAWFHVFHGIADFITQPLGEFEIVLAVSPKLASSADIKTTADLNQYPAINLIQTSFSFDNDRLSLSSAKQQVKTKDIHTLKALLLAGLGTALIPRPLISQELADGSLELISLSDAETNLSGEVRLIRNAECTLGPVGKFLWNSLKIK